MRELERKLDMCETQFEIQLMLLLHFNVTIPKNASKSDIANIAFEVEQRELFQR